MRELDLPAALERHVDLQALDAQRRTATIRPMSEAVLAEGLVFQGRNHRALNDARNAVPLARLLLQNLLK